MRKILFSLLLLKTFIGCDKNELGNLEYVETTKGGCFPEKGSSLKSDPFINSDTVTCSITNDILNVFVGFNALVAPDKVPHLSLKRIQYLDNY